MIEIRRDSLRFTSFIAGFLASPERLMALLGSQVDGSDGSSTSTLWVTGAGLGGGMTPRWSEARKRNNGVTQKVVSLSGVGWLKKAPGYWERNKDERRWRREKEKQDCLFIYLLNRYQMYSVLKTKMFCRLQPVRNQFLGEHIEESTLRCLIWIAYMMIDYDIGEFAILMVWQSQNAVRDVCQVF